MYTDDSSDFPQGMDPVAVIQSFDAAWNAHDVERALKFFTDDAEVRFMYPASFPEPDTYAGKDEIRRLLEGYLSDNFHMQSHDYRISLNEVTWQYSAASERFRQLGTDAVEGAAGAAFDHGKIKRLTVSFSPDSTAAITSGLDRAGVPGPISEGLAGINDAQEKPENGAQRPNRGPTWDAVGNEESQPPPHK
jgi:hypothetical protein